MGQQFERMSHLAIHVGADDFWKDLTPGFQSQYADICRVDPTKRLFALEKWRDSEVIQAAYAEYRLENPVGAENPANVNTEY
jgi:hypothetical protein